MNAAVGLMDGLGLDGDRCIRVIPQLVHIFCLQIVEKNPLAASYYLSIVDLSIKRCFYKYWSAKNIQPIPPSHSYDSEFNMHGKIQNILLYHLI